MDIAVIGAGSVGSMLGIAWARRGHRVAFGVRDPSGERVNDLKRASEHISVAANAEAVNDAEATVLCNSLGGNASRD